MTTSTVWKAATGALIALTLAPIRVEATITSVTVDAARDYDNARGYTYAEITVHGTVGRADGSVGVYAVPAVLIYPRQRRANRVGIVDWVNSAYYHFFPATTELGTFQFTLLATDDYLFDERDDELLARYQSRDQYERRVRRAADHLAASGYITHPDRTALIAAAKCEPLPEELPCRR